MTTNTGDTAQRRRTAALAGYRGDTQAALGAQNDPDHKVRIAALRSLARLNALNNDQIRQALNDPLAQVRIVTLEIVASLRHLPLEPCLENQLTQSLNDPDSMVVETAAWALGEREAKTDTTIDLLSQVARTHNDPLVRESAVAALGALADDRGLPAILDATSDKVAIRRRAVVALAPFDGPLVAAAYERARNDRDRQVRDTVEELLGPVAHQ